MLKKFGIVSAGVTATLLAAAPLASAGTSSVDADHNGDWGKSHSKDHDGWGKDKDHGKKGWGDPKGHGQSNQCAFRGGDAGNGNEGKAGAKGLIASTVAPVTQTAVGGANAPVLNCNNVGDILSKNFSHNLDKNEVNILNGAKL